MAFPGYAAANGRGSLCEHPAYDPDGVAREDRVEVVRVGLLQPLPEIAEVLDGLDPAHRRLDEAVEVGADADVPVSPVTSWIASMWSHIVARFRRCPRGRRVRPVSWCWAMIRPTTPSRWAISSIVSRPQHVGRSFEAEPGVRCDHRELARLAPALVVQAASRANVSLSASWRMWLTSTASAVRTSRDRGVAELG